MTFSAGRDLSIGILFFGGLIATACAGGDGGWTESAAGFDSTGVRRAFIAGEPDLMPFPSSPTLELGEGLDPQPGADFYRVVGAACLADGTLVVADGSSREVRFFSRRGRHITTSGGAGSGPGEFKRLTSFRRMGPDAVLVFDRSSMRLTVFDSRGELDEVWSVSPPPGELFYLVPTAANSRSVWLLTATTVVPSDTARVTRPNERLYRNDKASEHFALVDSFPGAARYEGPGAQIGVLPFASRTRFAANEALLAAVLADTLRIRQYDPAGTLSGEIEYELVGDALTEADRLRGRDSILGRARSHPLLWFRQQRTKLAEVMPFPERKPAVQSAVIDDEGRLWLTREREGARELLVVDRDGAYLARWSLPDGLRLTDVCADRVVGIRIADDGIETVVTYDRAILDRNMHEY